MDSDRSTPCGQSPPEPDPGDGSSRQNFRRRIEFSDECGVTGELVYRREGVLVQARRLDKLHAGVLEVVETQGQGVFITWDRSVVQQQEEEDIRNKNTGGNAGTGKVMINDQGHVAVCVGSPPSADWVIADNLQEPTTPIGQ